MASKHARELLSCARAVCENATVERNGSGHYTVTLRGPLGVRKVYISSTPSDWRTMRNFKTKIKKMAAVVGCKGE